MAWTLEYTRYGGRYTETFETRAQAERVRGVQEDDGEIFAVRLLHEGQEVRNYLAEYRAGMASMARRGGARARRRAYRETLGSA